MARNHRPSLRGILTLLRSGGRKSKEIMHPMLSAPGETLPITQTQSRIRGITRLPAFVVLLVTLLGSALPSFAQTWLANVPLPGDFIGPTFVALDTTRGFLYISEHGRTDGTGGGRI